MPELEDRESRGGRTHGARSEEERAAGKSQPAPAHTEQGVRVSSWQKPPQERIKTPS